MGKRAFSWKWGVILIASLTIAMVVSGCKHAKYESGPGATALTSFTANPATITLGQGTILAWTVNEGANAGNITYSIDQGVGEVDGTSVAVSPAVTTTYTLTATWPGGSDTAEITVVVQTFISKFVYVANDGSADVSAFTLDDDTGVLVEIEGSPFAAGPGPIHVTSDPEGRFLFVANGDEDTPSVSVFAIDPDTGALAEVDDSPFSTGDAPWCTAVSPDGAYVYVRCDGEIDAFSLDGASGALTPLDGSPFTATGSSGDIMVHPSGRYLFTPGQDSDEFHVFAVDTGSGALAEADGSPYLLDADTGPRGVAVDPTGEYVFVKGESSPSRAYGYRLDINTGELVDLTGSPFPTDDAFPGSDTFHGLTFSPVLNVLYTTFYEAESDLAAYAIDLETGELTEVAGSPYSWFEGSGSDQMAVSRNGKWAVAVNYDGDEIAEASVDPDTGGLTFIEYDDVGFEPSSVAIVGSVVEPD
jgi:6-phosphogluconolactonase